jgi:hypothetical protein
MYVVQDGLNHTIEVDSLCQVAGINLNLDFMQVSNTQDICIILEHKNTAYATL